MQAGAAGLRRGRILVLFPEGERSIDGTVRAFKKGAAILAHHLAVPIVPVGIDGLFDLWGRNREFRWRKLAPGAGTIHLRIGDPIHPDSGAPAAAADEVVYSALTTRLRTAVMTLWESIAARPDAAARRQVS